MLGVAISIRTRRTFAPWSQANLGQEANRFIYIHTNVTLGCP